MIQDYKEYHTENTVHFVIKLSPEQMAKVEAIGLHKFFKVLNATISDCNREENVSRSFLWL